MAQIQIIIYEFWSWWSQTNGEVNYPDGKSLFSLPNEAVSLWFCNWKGTKIYQKVTRCTSIVFVLVWTTTAPNVQVVFFSFRIIQLKFCAHWREIRSMAISPSGALLLDSHPIQYSELFQSYLGYHPFLVVDCGVHSLCVKIQFLTIENKGLQKCQI